MARRGGGRGLGLGPGGAGPWARVCAFTLLHSVQLREMAGRPSSTLLKWSRGLSGEKMYVTTTLPSTVKCQRIAQVHVAVSRSAFYLLL